jgi:hypothetical protein
LRGDGHNPPLAGDDLLGPSGGGGRRQVVALLT